MENRRSHYEFEELLACGRGELFGEGNAQLPLPPMLMFDRITEVTADGGAHKKGRIVAEFTAAAATVKDVGLAMAGVVS